MYFAGLLEPLPIGAPNFRERLDGLLAAMSADILGRVLDDKLEEDRCCKCRIALQFVEAEIIHPCYEDAHYLGKCSQTFVAASVYLGKLQQCVSNAIHLCLGTCVRCARLVSCRWPLKFELQMRAFRNSDRKSKTAVRSCSFPSPLLLEPAADSQLHGRSTSINAETGTGTCFAFSIVCLQYRLPTLQHFHALFPWH